MLRPAPALQDAAPFKTLLLNGFVNFYASYTERRLEALFEEPFSVTRGPDDNGDRLPDTIIWTREAQGPAGFPFRSPPAEIIWSPFETGSLSLPPRLPDFYSTLFDEISGEVARLGFEISTRFADEFNSFIRTSILDFNGDQQVDTLVLEIESDDPSLPDEILWSFGDAPVAVVKGQKEPLSREFIAFFDEEITETVSRVERKLETRFGVDVQTGTTGGDDHDGPSVPETIIWDIDGGEDFLTGPDEIIWHLGADLTFLDDALEIAYAFY